MTVLSQIDDVKPIPYKELMEEDYPHTVAELTITPELQEKINKARKEFLEGKTLHFENADEAIKWMESL